MSAHDNLSEEDGYAGKIIHNTKGAIQDWHCLNQFQAVVRAIFQFLF